MDHKEHERRIRHIMCIFLALESFLICLFAVIFNFGMLIGNWESLYYHLSTPADGIMLPILSILPVGCTILSIYRKWFYRIYEGFHCLLGILSLILSGSFSVGFIILLILSA
ncbi:MAG: hypothetical protein J1E40_08830, partial [Oscillospiraceae bacterium]|nr:hypothetical protein [Oscillospiraceae bacterium]